ncbi:MAG TPA: transglycosylase SLT domain-containing protein [Bryobacteraceae bacterium]|nr:transglycosylase SLT domain-containing protein [Bryobacteraceae bacterium]
MNYRAGILILIAASACQAQTLARLSGAYQTTPTPANRTALVQFASEHARDQQGALAQLALAYTDVQNNRLASAAQAAEAARKGLPTLSDYTLLLSAQSMRVAEPSNAAARALQVLAQPGPSPMDTQALQVAAWAFLEAGDPEAAVRALQPNLELIPPSVGGMLLARSLQSSNQLGSAALQYQRVYFEFPLSREAGDAGLALAQLRQQLADRYPPPLAQQILSRARILIFSGEAVRATAELNEALKELAGPERDLARVLLGAARYFRAEYQAAIDYLSTLNVTLAESDAERLYYVLQSQRRLDRLDHALETWDRLRSQYPKSDWLLKATVALADTHLVRNEPERYLPLYRSCAELFPMEERGSYCHWKVAWHDYSTQRDRSTRLFREHLERYPSSAKISAALYFLGRIHELRNETAVARAFYDAIGTRFPNSYYNVQALQRLAESKIQGARPAAVTVQYLRFLRESAPQPDFSVDPATRSRIDRARLLALAGLEDWAEQELRFGARTDGKGPALAHELAQMVGRRGDHAVAVRSIKALAPGYLSWDLPQAPVTFWRLAFPMPYRADLEKRGAQQSIDPNLLAALIRQESEFDPRAVSRSRAVGLTQILPSTGRDLSRKLKLGPYRGSMLYQPEINLQMGAYYLRWLLTSLDNKYEAALAAYNAGKTRATRWLGWFGDDREQAEFIECIPFSETRDYIQIVLRNADIYRRLYSGGTSDSARMLDSSSGTDPSHKGPSPNAGAGRRASAGTPQVP